MAPVPPPRRHVIPVPPKKGTVAAPPPRTGVSPKGGASATSFVPDTRQSVPTGAFAQAAAEREAAEERRKLSENKPWPLALENGEKDRFSIILDRHLTPDNIFTTYVHKIKRRRHGKDTWDTIPCLRGVGHCPACDIYDQGSFLMILTAIDTKPYTIKNGPKAGQIVRNQRRPIEITQGSTETFQNLWARHIEGKRKHGFRGMMLRHSRSNKATAPRIGDEILFHKWVTENELAPLGDQGKALDYSLAYPTPSEENLKKVLTSLGNGTYDGSTESEESGVPDAAAGLSFI